MAKRPAQEPLEEIAAAESPAAKKPRAEKADLPPPPPPQDETTSVNGHTTANGALDITTADTEQHAELLEAPALSPSSDADSDPEIPSTRQKAPTEGYADLYLSTINRSALDFDFLRQCSITLSPQNVYACLICGKYFSGRGASTPAYFHALEVDHHVYINMETKKVYVLPEGYEVRSKGLEDIKGVVDPQFTREEVRKLDSRGLEQPAWDLAGRKYYPGFVGLNNIKANDYLNVVAQALAHVGPLRNFLLLEDLSARPSLVRQFAALVRKLWNPRAFKSHVSPHELMQEISLRSGKKYNLTTQSDPAEFLSWFLNNLHLDLGGRQAKPPTSSTTTGSSKHNAGPSPAQQQQQQTPTSLIHHIFQGHLRLTSQKITATSTADDRLIFNPSQQTTTQHTPFTLLPLDLPPAPLFQSSQEEKNIIPQVPLTRILEKYNGELAQENLNSRTKYRLLHPLPRLLVMHVKRFARNKFLSVQRNPTIVTFNPRGLDMAPYVEPLEGAPQQQQQEPILYDLVANVTYEGVKVRDDSVEGEAERKVWKVLVKEGGAGEGGKAGEERWWEMQDLFVQRVNRDLLATKESYVMVWERRKTATTTTAGAKR